MIHIHNFNDLLSTNDLYITSNSMLELPRLTESVDLSRHRSSPLAIYSYSYFMTDIILMIPLYPFIITNQPASQYKVA